MDLVAKLPSMEDAALAVLHENAERLEHSGTAAQRNAAAALRPAVAAEIASRRAAKLAAASARRPAKRTTKTAGDGGETAPARRKRRAPARPEDADGTGPVS